MSKESIKQLSCDLESCLLGKYPTRVPSSDVVIVDKEPAALDKNMDLKTLALAVVANEHKMGRAGVTDDKLISFQGSDSDRKLVCDNDEVRELVEIINGDVKPDYSCMVVAKSIHKNPPFNPWRVGKFLSDCSKRTELGPMLDIIFAHPHLFIAGGFASSIVTGREFDDVDVFIVGASLSEAIGILASVRRMVAEKCSHDVEMYTTRLATTFVLGDTKIQIIHRLYSSRAEVLYGFDLGSSAMGISHGNVIVMTPSGLLAGKHRFNVVDINKRRPTLEARMEKYLKRGFNLVMPRASPSLFAGMRERVEPINTRFWSFDQKIGEHGIVVVLLLKRRNEGSVPPKSTGDGLYSSGNGLYSAGAGFSYGDHGATMIKNLEELSRKEPRGRRIMLRNKVMGDKTLDLFRKTFANCMFDTNINKKFFSVLERFVGVRVADLLYASMRRMEDIDDVDAFITKNMEDIIKNLNEMLVKLVPVVFVDNQSDTCITGSGPQFLINEMTEREWYGDLYFE